MARALFITDLTLKQLTPIKGAVDSDKLNENIIISQDTGLRDIIGTDLLDKISDDINSGSLANPYLSLVNNQIKYYLAYATASDYILTAGYSVDDGGLSRYSPTNGTQMTTDEINILSSRMDDKANFYGQRLIKYLDDNKADFPEYTGSSTSSTFNGWQLDDNYGCDNF